MPTVRSSAIVACLVALTASPLTAQGAPRPERFDLDPDHSEIAFTVGFMGLSSVRGAFSEVRGTVMIVENDPARSSVTVAIRSASINTNSIQRDRHLRSPDFFDVEKFPSVIFRSTGVARTPEGFIASGPLSLHGVTRDIRIPFTLLHGRRTDAWGNTRIGARGRVVLNRKDYGIQGTAFWNNEFDPGRMAIGDSVTVDLLVEAVIANMDRIQAPRADSLLRVAAERGVAAVAREYRAAAAGDSALRLASETMLINAGRKALQHAQVPTAVELLTLAVELNPSSSMVAAYQGEALRAAGRTADARMAFQHSLAINAANTMALEGLRVTGTG